MNKAVTLKKQALERWAHVPPAKQKKLVEELKTREPGHGVIELRPGKDIPWRWGDAVDAKIVDMLFGMDVTQRENRYLLLSDIPQPKELQQESEKEA